MSIKDEIFEEYGKGNIVINGLEGLQIMPIDKFIEQPTDGMLYDLNRGEEVVLSFVNEHEKWINDYAVAKVIRRLKNRIAELEEIIEEACVE